MSKVSFSSDASLVYTSSGIIYVRMKEDQENNGECFHCDFSLVFYFKIAIFDHAEHKFTNISFVFGVLKVLLLFTDYNTHMSGSVYVSFV